MNIALFTKRTTFHEGFGGLETQNRLLCEGLVSRGHTVTVFSPDWGIKLDTADENGVRYKFVKCVYRMGPVFGFFGTLQKSNWINRSYEEFLTIHKKTAFDLIVAQSSTGLGLIRSKKIHGIPVVSISHGTILGEYKTFAMSMILPRDLSLLIKNTAFVIKNFFRKQRDFVHGSRRIVAVSKYVKQALVEETFVDDAKVVVINNGIDPKPFFPSDKVFNRGTKLVYIGQILKSKGLEEIIEILKDPRFSTNSIDIIGSGELLPVLKAKVGKDTELSSRVNFVGKVPYANLIESYFKNEDYGVFIFPTKRYEGFPMVLVEALFSGLPVVVYDNGGVADAIENGKSGYLVRYNNFTELKDCVYQLLNDRELRNSFSQYALKLAYEKFTIAKMLDKYEQVFTEVLK